MENIRNTFEEDCKIINLKYEYPGYIGEAKFGVITALSEEELERSYAEQLSEYRPYIVLSPAFGEIRTEFVRNEKKHAMRRQRSESIFGFDENTESVHIEIACPGTEEEYLSLENQTEVSRMISELTEVQQRRIRMYFYEGYTMREIAEKEAVGLSKVEKSISQSIKKFRKQFDL